MSDTVRAGGDGSCPCGTCHVPYYDMFLQALDAGLCPSVVIEDGEPFAGIYEPTPSDLRWARSENLVERSIWAIRVARLLERTEPTS